jgi:RNA polymerase sigma-70 factor (ECF subfamily)
MADQDTLPAWEAKALAALHIGETDEALHALIAGCGQAILAYCLARLGDVAIANDVAQEVFVAAWEALPDFRRDSSLRTWIFVIAHHRCANRRRTLGRFARMFSQGIDEAVAQAPADPADLPEAAVMQRQQAEQVQRALGKLRRKERDLLTMYYIEELSLDKIAERYSVSRGTISRQLAEAQHKLKRMMDR